jgi:L-iditol 2-dehydrogenase
MKALAKLERRKGAVGVIDMDEPEYGPNEVQIKIQAAAVCGSDLHAYEFLPGYQTPAETKIPVILGHEWSGVIAATGRSVAGFKVGERVMGESIQFCGVCDLCRKGRTNICSKFTLTGRHVDGAMAGYFKIDPRYLHRIPEGLSFEEASTAQPLAVSLHAVIDNCAIAPGDTVLVFGPGVIGLGAAQAARLLGATMVVIAGLARDEKVRLPTARKLGFATLNADSNDVATDFHRLTGSHKADVVIDCSGDSLSIPRGLELTARGGHMTIVGISAGPASVFYTPVVRNEIQLHTTFNATWSNYDQALRLMASKQIDMQTLISSHSLGEAIGVFDAALECDLVKPVLCPA